MIKNIIFDFGGVFINLDKEVVFREMEFFQKMHLLPKFAGLNEALEVGAISGDHFLETLQGCFPDTTKSYIEKVWNGMLLDLPEYRLEFLEGLVKKGTHRIFLLSNTNAIHIPYVSQQMGLGRFERFRNCFEKFYLSHEIGLRKPNKEVFEFVLTENNLRAEETLFIDDTEEHTLGAKSIGIKTWHLQIEDEDVIQLNAKL